MRAHVGICAVVALRLCVAIDAQGQGVAAARPTCPDTGSVGTVYGTVRGDRSNTPVANAEITAAGTSCSTLSDSAGRYVLRGVPAGRAHLHVSFIGYLARNDSVLVPVGDSVRLPLPLGEMESTPAPYTTVPLPTRDRRLAMVSVLTLYRQRASGGETAAYLETLRITQTPVEVAASGRVPLVLWLGGSDSVYRQDTAWARAQRLPVCWARDKANCPGRGVTTFLRLAAPGRIAPDSVFFSVREIVTDPAACRRGNAFVGFAEHDALVIRDSVGWRGVRFLDGVNLAGSGSCGRPAR